MHNINTETMKTDKRRMNDKKQWMTMGSSSTHSYYHTIVLSIIYGIIFPFLLLHLFISLQSPLSYIIITIIIPRDNVLVY